MAPSWLRLEAQGNMFLSITEPRHQDYKLQGSLCSDIKINHQSGTKLCLFWDQNSVEIAVSDINSNGIHIDFSQNITQQ